MLRSSLRLLLVIVFTWQIQEVTVTGTSTCLRTQLWCIYSVLWKLHLFLRGVQESRCHKITLVRLSSDFIRSIALYLINWPTTDSKPSPPFSARMASIVRLRPGSHLSQHKNLVAKFFSKFWSLHYTGNDMFFNFFLMCLWSHWRLQTWQCDSLLKLGAKQSTLISHHFL